MEDAREARSLRWKIDVGGPGSKELPSGHWRPITGDPPSAHQRRETGGSTAFAIGRSGPRGSEPGIAPGPRVLPNGRDSGLLERTSRCQHIPSTTATRVGTQIGRFAPRLHGNVLTGQTRPTHSAIGLHGSTPLALRGCVRVGRTQPAVAARPVGDGTAAGRAAGPHPSMPGTAQSELARPAAAGSLLGADQRCQEQTTQREAERVVTQPADRSLIRAAT